MHPGDAPPRARRVLTATTGVALGAVLGAALSACSGPARPTVELTNAPRAADAPTATVTVTRTATRTLSTTVPVPVVRTVTVSVTPTVTVTALPRPALTTSRTFDRTAALAAYARLVADVRRVDAVDASSPPAALLLDDLTAHLAALAAGGSPPGLDAPTYYARLEGLRLFTAAATREAEAGSPQASARWGVIRQEVGAFLSLVDGALGTNLVLPPVPPAPAPSPPTTPPPR